MKYTTILIVLISLLSLSLLKMPYFYYQILHWVVCIANGYIAWRIAENEPKNRWLWVFIGIAILFNPIAPFFFGKDVWLVIDVLAIVVYCIFLFYTRNRLIEK